MLNVEQALAKALLVDADALAAAQQAGDVLGAHGVLMDAYDTDVRAVLADRREARGLPRDPMAAYRRLRLRPEDRRRPGRRHPGRLGPDRTLALRCEDNPSPA